MVVVVVVGLGCGLDGVGVGRCVGEEGVQFVLSIFQKSI